MLNLTSGRKFTRKEQTVNVTHYTLNGMCLKWIQEFVCFLSSEGLWNTIIQVQDVENLILSVYCVKFRKGKWRSRAIETVKAGLVSIIPGLRKGNQYHHKATTTLSSYLYCRLRKIWKCHNRPSRYLSHITSIRFAWYYLVSLKVVNFNCVSQWQMMACHVTIEKPITRLRKLTFSVTDPYIVNVFCHFGGPRKHWNWEMIIWGLEKSDVRKDFVELNLRLLPWSYKLALIYTPLIMQN